MAAKFISQWHYFLEVSRALSVSKACGIDVKSRYSNFEEVNSLKAMNHPKINKPSRSQVSLFPSNYRGSYEVRGTVIVHCVRECGLRDKSSKNISPQYMNLNSFTYFRKQLCNNSPQIYLLFLLRVFYEWDCHRCGLQDFSSSSSVKINQIRVQWVHEFDLQLVSTFDRTEDEHTCCRTKQNRSSHIVEGRCTVRL